MVILNQWQQKHLLEWCDNLPEGEMKKSIEIDVNLVKDFLKDKQTLEDLRKLMKINK